MSAVRLSDKKRGIPRGRAYGERVAERAVDLPAVGAEEPPEGGARGNGDVAPPVRGGGLGERGEIHVTEIRQRLFREEKFFRFLRENKNEVFWQKVGG